MKLSIIVAMASNRAIGMNNQIPWHLSADLKRFKKITLGSSLVMGRKTFDSIGRPLPGRTNIIITRNLAYEQHGCIVVNDIESALATACQNGEQVFVIGGSELYEAILPVAGALYITQINRAYPGDAFFPPFEANDWLETEREDIDNDPDAPFSYSFLKLERRTR